MSTNNSMSKNDDRKDAILREYQEYLLESEKPKRRMNKYERRQFKKDVKIMKKIQKNIDTPGFIESAVLKVLAEFEIHD